MTLKPKLLKFPLWLLPSVFGFGAAASEIKEDEYVQMIRSIATIDKDDHVHAHVSVWVYEKEERPGAKQVFAQFIGMDLDAQSPEEKENFDYRTQLFRFDSESLKRVALTATNQTIHVLPDTDSDGISRAVLDLGKRSELKVDNTATISLNVLLPDNDKRQFSAHYIVVPETGVSIVSDIDDTIKESHVLNRDELIKNTFLRRFKAVPGMSSWYAQLAAQDKSTRFHYLSSSPHQLYPALDGFLQNENFPLGSVHLRYIDLSEELFGNGNSSKRHKLSTLQTLIEQFPQRQFVLIGDSGEADPEIYAEIARRYPAQVRAIYIRNVSQEPREAVRYAKTFDGLPSSLWTVFDTPPN